MSIEAGPHALSRYLEVKLKEAGLDNTFTATPSNNDRFYITTIRALRNVEVTDDRWEELAELVQDIMNDATPDGSGRPLYEDIMGQAALFAQYRRSNGTAQRQIGVNFNHDTIYTHEARISFLLGRDHVGIMQRIAASDPEGFARAFPGMSFNPEWRTDTVVALLNEARKDPGVSPILADALEDAGCDNPNILGQCRDAKPNPTAQVAVLGYLAHNAGLAVN